MRKGGDFTCTLIVYPWVQFKIQLFLYTVAVLLCMQTTTRSSQAYGWGINQKVVWCHACLVERQLPDQPDLLYQPYYGERWLSKQQEQDAGKMSACSNFITKLAVLTRSNGRDYIEVHGMCLHLQALSMRYVSSHLKAQ